MICLPTNVALAVLQENKGMSPQVNMVSKGWNIWIVSNTGLPGFVVYRKDEPASGEQPCTL